MKLTDLLPTQEASSETDLALIPNGQGPDTATMKEAAPLAVWQPFETQIAEKKAAAVALLKTEVTPENCAVLAPSFRRLRLDIVPVRTGIDKKAKSLNADDEKRIKERNEARFKLREICSDMEAQLLEREQFSEREEARLSEVRRVERVALLEPLGVDCQYLSLAGMPEEAFQTMLAGAKAAKEARAAELAKIEEDARQAALAQAAKEKAEAEAREAQRIENERLKKEMTEREAAARKEREELEAKAAKERAEAAERAKEAEAKAKAERDALAEESARKAAEAKKIADAAAEKARKEREAAEAIAAQEKAARQKLQDEIDARRLEDENRKAEKIEAERKLEAAGDREKLLSFKDSIRAVDCPNLKNSALSALISDQQHKFIKWIEKQATEL